MRTAFSPVLLLVVAFLAAPSCAQETERRALALDDWGTVKFPHSPRFSPDGEELIYHVENHAYLVTDDPAAPQRLTDEEAGGWGVHWSADGESIYFYSDFGDGSQLYRMSADGQGEREQITEFPKGVSSGNLSPDESLIAVLASDDDLRKASENPEPIVVTRRHFKRDAGHGYITDGSLSHLHLYDVETREMRQLTSGNFDDGWGEWSPDSKSIVFASNRQEVPDTDYRSDIFVIDLKGDEHALRRLTDDKRTKLSPQFSPDGETIAFLASDDGIYAINRLVVMSVDGDDERVLTRDFDRAVHGHQWSADGEWLYFRYENRGSGSLGRVNVETGHIESLITGEQVIFSYEVSPTGALAYLSREGTGGFNLYRHANERTMQLTDMNREFFDGVKLGEKRKVTHKSTDGYMIDTFITLPTDYEEGRKYPAVLDIHGGPVGQFGWGFSFDAQYYANNGYVVIQPNPRGSSGRGDAFVKTIYQVWGVPDYDDVMAAVDYAVEEGIADPDRLVVTGYSYGGYMTNVVITQTDRFVAAASGAGHSYIQANVGHDIYSQWYFWELGNPWENREAYDVHSPYVRVGNVTTPTLFYGGRVDWNVPIVSAELMYQALQVMGVDSQLVVYPGVYHNGWGPDFEKDSLQRRVDWFDKYTK